MIRRHLGKWFFLMVLGMGLIGLPGWTEARWQARAGLQKRVRLFEYLAATVPGKAAEVRINLEALRMPEVGVVEVETPAGNTFPVGRTEFEGRSMNSFTWRGKAPHPTGSQHDVTISAVDGVVSGLLYLPTGTFQVIPQAGNRHVIEKVDFSSFKPCGGAVPVAASNAVEPTVVRSGTPEVDNGSRIDVMVLYTAAARTAAGGTTQIQATAQSAVDITNTAYANSNITTRLQMVYTGELDFSETGTASQMLSNFRANTTAQALRDQYRADLMSLIVEVLPSACGIGYVMTNVNTTFASSAYSITDRGCAVGNLSFAHELGHTQGSQHDPANGGTAAYAYSYGHFVDGQFRTVMSYSSECTQGCTRVAHFSNPNVNYTGLPTGLAGTRDNAQSLNNTAVTVSNFRESVTPVPTITRFTPIASAPGKTLTVVGTNFVSGSTQVFFGGTRLIPAAAVTVANSTTLTVTIPSSGTGTANLNGYVTVRVNGNDATTSNLPDTSTPPCNGTATFPEFVLWGDTNGDGALANSNDVALSRAFSQFQATPTVRQRLATDVTPVNGICRGDGAITTADISFLRAVSFGQATF
ncbi:MAG: hypothetical protein K1Y36_10255 [Blastocatellia bacterium]|nr:hypothetical protein [Blastocatellia bacterium]